MSNERIMIFADENTDKTNLIKKLHSWDYQTSYFPIKSLDITASSQIKPDLILMDLTHDLEDNGIEMVFDLIKKFDTPLIYLSHDNHDLFVKRNISFKPYIYIQKPYNDNQLKLAVEMAIYRDNSYKMLNDDEVSYKLLDRAPIPYHSLDNHGYLLDVNQTWLEKLGYTREEVLGRWFGDIVAPEHIETFNKNFSKLKDNGELLAQNFEIIHKNGYRINVTLDCMIAYDENNNFIQTHCVFQDFTEQKKAEDALKISEQYYKTIFENSGAATVVIEEDNIISLVNSEFEKLYGYKKEDIEGKTNWMGLVSKEHIPKMIEFHEKRMIDPESVPRNYEFNLIDSTGNIRNIYTTVAIIPGTTKTLVSLQDITSHNKTENELKNSINDKDMLLREIHHRVKNNLQIVSSLLNLQSQYIKDQIALDVFKESQNRVRSMAIIHEKLYKSTDMSKIDFADYISDLTESLFFNYRIDPSKIRLTKKLDNVFFDVDTAIPCGLIVNELITNCLKHAFPDDRRGNISVELSKNDTGYFLCVKDDGIGFADDIDYKNTESLGLQLVNNLVSQIDGTIEFDSTGGSCFNIKFKELEYKKL
jgi:PAS domain S-box-containing protein